MNRSSTRLLRVVTFVYALALIVVTMLPSGGALGGWDEDITPSLQNTLHVPAYALLAALVMLAMVPDVGAGYGRILLVALCCCLFGIALEFVQAFIPGRSASLIDAALNVIGVLTGGALAIGWQGSPRRRETEASERATEQQEAR